jgi:serine/threonine protein phosphatase PrpC
VKFAERLDEVDPERVALWGDSYTGGQVIVVGAIEPRVKAIVKIPVFGAEPPEVDPNRANVDIITKILSRGDVRGSAETTIGFMPVVSFDQVGTVIGPGDVLLMYTDGLTKVVDPGDEEFGREQLASLLRDAGDLSVSALVDRAVGAAQAFAASEKPFDGVTLIAVKRLG